MHYDFLCAAILSQFTRFIIFLVFDVVW